MNVKMSAAEEYAAMRRNKEYDPENKLVNGEILNAEEEISFNDGSDSNGTGEGYCVDADHDGRYSYGRDDTRQRKQNEDLERDQYFGINCREYEKRYEDEVSADDAVMERRYTRPEKEDDMFARFTVENDTDYENEVLENATREMQESMAREDEQER